MALAEYTLVLVEAGHSNISLIRRFALEPIDHVRLVVINPDTTVPYSGMLSGYLVGQYFFERSLHLMIAAPSAIARKVIQRWSAIGLSP